MIKRIICCVICCSIVLMSFVGCTKFSTVSVNDYGEFFKDKYVTAGMLDVFPRGLPNSAEVNEYIFDYAIQPISGAYVQLFLDVTYSEEDFEKEAERIKSIDYACLFYENEDLMDTEIHEGMTCVFPKDEILYDESTFSYPAYVALYDEKKAYEYVFLFEEDCRIVSVYLEFCPEEQVIFNKQYLPIGYECAAY